MLKKYYRIILLHITLSILIPFFISIIIFYKPHYFGISVQVDLYEIFWYLTCSTQMLLPSIVFYYPIRYSFQIVLMVLFSILFRLSILAFFIFLHNNKEKIGKISDVLFIITNIVVGLFFLALLGKA